MLNSEGWKSLLGHHTIVELFTHLPVEEEGRQLRARIDWRN